MREQPAPHSRPEWYSRDKALPSIFIAHDFHGRYLWIPGIHGTVGICGFDTSVHVTAGEIFSNFRGGLLGVFTPTYNRFLAPVDYMWMRLRDSKAIPYNPAYSVQATLNFSIVTPKVAYLVANSPRSRFTARPAHESGIWDQHSISYDL